MKNIKSLHQVSPAVHHFDLACVKHTVTTPEGLAQYHEQTAVNISLHITDRQTTLTKRICMRDGAGKDHSKKT